MEVEVEGVEGVEGEGVKGEVGSGLEREAWKRWRVVGVWRPATDMPAARWRSTHT